MKYSADCLIVSCVRCWDKSLFQISLSIKYAIYDLTHFMTSSFCSHFWTCYPLADRVKYDGRISNFLTSEFWNGERVRSNRSLTLICTSFLPYIFVRLLVYASGSKPYMGGQLQPNTDELVANGQCLLIFLLICIYLVPDKPTATRLTSNITGNTVIRNLSVTFHCSADSVPHPVLELRFKNSSLGYFIDGLFTIERVRASDEGKYECVPSNIIGVGRIATLNLSVVGKYRGKNHTINSIFGKHKWIWREMLENMHFRNLTYVDWSFLGRLERVPS